MLFLAFVILSSIARNILILSLMNYVHMELLVIEKVYVQFCRYYQSFSK